MTVFFFCGKLKNVFNLKLKLIFKFIYPQGIYDFRVGWKLKRGTIMARTNEYQTRQRQAIVEYLDSHRGDYVTVSDLANFFQASGEHVSVTTIYRHLEKLTTERRVEKYHIDGMKSACFCAAKTLTGADTDNLTMKCQSCGEMVHFSCPDLSHLYAHFAEEHRISIDPRRTVFYGKCDKCNGRIIDGAK